MLTEKVIKRGLVRSVPGVCCRIEECTFHKERHTTVQKSVTVKAPMIHVNRAI